MDINTLNSLLDIAKQELEKGKFQKAEGLYNLIIKNYPDNSTANHFLGLACINQNKFTEGLDFILRSISLEPDNPNFLNNLGTALFQNNETGQAILAFQKALEIIPCAEKIHNNLGTAFLKTENYPAAENHFKRAIEINPEFIKAYYNLVNVLEYLGKLDETRQYCQKLHLLEPENQFINFHIDTLLPAVYADKEEMDYYYNHISTVLNRYLENRITTDVKKYTFFNCQLIFLLTYQGKNDREIRENFARIFKPFFPSVQVGKNSSEKKQIAFLVTQSHEESFIKCMAGILNHLLTDELEISIICNSTRIEVLKKNLTNKKLKFVIIPLDFEQSVEIIKSFKFDLIYYWEIGTEPNNYFFPFLRLAEIQCTGWGWPVTSGIAEMDFYISGELLETPESSNFYTEKLICFKTLPTYFYRPVKPRIARSRDYFNLSAKGNLYLCMQNLLKILPDFDQLIFEIINKDPLAIIVFIENKEYITSLFKERLNEKGNFVQEGRIVFVPKLVLDDYLSLLEIGDLVLDTTHFSGAISTYDAFGMGIPVVTLPGRLSRSRYTYALYKKMNITGCIAEDEADFVNIALKLATDKKYNLDIRKKIAEKSDLLFEDMEAVKEFEVFFKEVLNKTSSH